MVRNTVTVRVKRSGGGPELLTALLPFRVRVRVRETVTLRVKVRVKVRILSCCRLFCKLE